MIKVTPIKEKEHRRWWGENGLINQILAALTVILVGLKLNNNINCHWLWVLSPILIPLVISIILFSIGYTLQFLIFITKWYKLRKLRNK